MTIEGQGTALRDALTEELRRREGDDAPQILYAWSRAVPPASGAGVVMFARVRRNHRSAIVESSGPDGETAFIRLVERTSAWSHDGQSPAPRPEQRSA